MTKKTFFTKNFLLHQTTLFTEKIVDVKNYEKEHKLWQKKNFIGHKNQKIKKWIKCKKEKKLCWNKKIIFGQKSILQIMKKFKN